MQSTKQSADIISTQRIKLDSCLHEIAFGFETCRAMSIKAERQFRDMRMVGRIARVQSTKQSADIISIQHIKPDSCLHEIAFGFETCLAMSIKAERQFRDMRMASRIARVQSTKQSADIISMQTI